MKRKLHFSLQKVTLIRLLLVVSLALAFSVMYSPTRAQQSPEPDKGIQVSPPTQEKTADPGSTVQFTAKVTNQGDSNLPVTVQVNAITQSGDEGQVSLLSTTEDIAGWTTVTPTSFTLPKGGSQEVTATVTVPKDAAGGHYGSIVFNLAGTPTAQGPGLSQQVGSLFLLTINGTLQEKMSVVSFKAPSFSESGPINFDLTLKNSGNVHVKPEGLITVTDMFGRQVASVPIDGQNVFPGKNRIMQTTLNKQWLVGPLTAEAVMYYGTVNRQSLDATTSFFVFPYRLALAGLLVIIVLYLLRKRIGKAAGALAGK